MKVVLLKDVSGVGKEWDVVDVADGYARNVLLREGKAAKATGDMVKKAEEVVVRTGEQEEKGLEAVQRFAQQLDGFEVTVKARANEHGDLYAEMRPKLIAEALAREGHHVQTKAILTQEPIKQVGEYRVTVSLDHGLEAEILIIVQAATAA